MRKAEPPTDNNHQGTMNPPINPSNQPQSGHQQSVMAPRSGGPVFVSPEGQFHVSLDTKRAAHLLLQQIDIQRQAMDLLIRMDWESNDII